LIPLVIYVGALAQLYMKLFQVVAKTMLTQMDMVESWPYGTTALIYMRKELIRMV